MFTNNYITFKRLMFECPNYNKYTQMTLCDGSSANIYAVQCYAADIGYWMTQGRCKEIVATFDSGSSSHAGNSGYAGVYFGTGTTAATKNDYALESPITSGLTITNPSRLVTKNMNERHIFVSDFVVRNDTSNNIVINEVGIFTPTSSENGASVNSVAVSHVLMERTVLDAPITIPAGEARLIEYAIVFNAQRYE